MKAICRISIATITKIQIADTAKYGLTAPIAAMGSTPLSIAVSCVLTKPSREAATARAPAKAPTTAKVFARGPSSRRIPGFHTKAKGSRKPTMASRTAENAILKGSSSAIAEAAIAATAIGGVSAERIA